MEDTVQVFLQRHYRGNQPSVEHHTPLVPEDAVADISSILTADRSQALIHPCNYILYVDSVFFWCISPSLAKQVADKRIADHAF